MRTVRLSVLSLLLACFNLSTSAQNFQQGVYHEETLFSITMYDYDGCLPDPVITLYVDSTLQPYLTGVELVWAVTGSNLPPNSVISDSAGMGISLNVGDILPIDSVNHGYPIKFVFNNYNSSGNITLELVARGTPQLANESYWCNVEGAQTLAFCDNVGLIFADTMNSVPCSTTPMSVLDPDRVSIQVFPNPATHEFQLEMPASTEAYELRLHDLNGRLLRTWSHSDANARYSIDEFPAGMYALNIFGPDGTAYRRLLRKE